MMRIIAVGVALLAFVAGWGTLYLIATVWRELGPAYLMPWLLAAGVCSGICIWLGVAIILFEVRSPDA